MAIYYTVPEKVCLLTTDSSPYIGILSLGDISSRCPRVVWLKLMDSNIEHETKRLLLHNSLFIKWICNEMVTI